ncbi:dipeptide/oligopeptide/nickel ABC transporter permease/ATP-binding protein [Pseudoclavibacter sp. RFBB5]|uniref:dipeptide/oligopeptide/nickel ABC transporter permease/ATP-binding protein n=1 Tax=Pseudoclavibacter sp. RFBB5 TaxID=2080574 RepID=UPI000CE859CE|nr:dipeptide/oligopeptide/nickel ABC transporter permease/ATP-binding protein [Pseudoclavibacter sp. RFBB5]PPG27680.1 ABC transporter [Pseudoclavibacter sp. RFBB5]
MTADLVSGTSASLQLSEEDDRRPGVLRRLLRDPAVVVSASFILVVILAAICAPLLTSYDPLEAKIADVLAPPFTAEHPLGADGVGRDVWANLLYGARTSLISAAIVIGVSMAIGIPSGLLAGYRRGLVDGISVWISGALMSLPAIVVLLVVLARVGRSSELALAVFGVLIAPSVFLLIRSSVRAVREELYVDAAKVSGLGDTRIMRRHILPVVIKPTIIQAAMLASAGIGIEAGIAFLGLGSSDRSSWGLMLQDASQNIYSAPVLLLWPSLALVLTIMSFTLIGNGIRDALSDHTIAPTRKVRNARNVVANRASEPTAPRPEVTTHTPAGQLIGVEGLRVSYPRADGGETMVVKQVSLTLERGEILGLVGESGSGKSQTAFSVLGLLPPEARMQADALTFNGQDLLELSPKKRAALLGKSIGYIPQEPMSNLDPAFRIGFQLTQPMRHHLGLGKNEAKAEALRLLARVGIPDPERLFRSYPHEISGGMAQRVLIAGAVSCNPDLLIADEPTTALDVTVQADVLELIRDLQAERGMGVIIVTHNFGVVADICDRVAVMRSGEIVEVAEVTELFARPQHEYTRSLLASTLGQVEWETDDPASSAADGIPSSKGANA